MFYTAEQVKEIKRLRKFAEKNIVSLKYLMGVIAGFERPIGDNPNYVIHVAGDRIVFSLEQQPQCKTRHMSISNQENHLIKDKISELLKVLGFKDHEKISVWPEGTALNFLEPIFEEEKVKVNKTFVIKKSAVKKATKKKKVAKE